MSHLLMNSLHKLDSGILQMFLHKKYKGPNSEIFDDLSQNGWTATRTGGDTKNTKLKLQVILCSRTMSFGKLTGCNVF